MDQLTRPAEPTRLSQAEVRRILVGVILAMSLAALDQTIVATALPTIGRELGDFEHMPWIVTAYLLASTAVTPLYGKVSDIYGRRVTILFGVATFVVGSIACAVAPTMLTLILARALQGLGGGGLIALAQTVIADIIPPKERARYQIHIASVFVASSLLGPVLGGFFSEHLHWSVIFWINVPLGAFAFWLSNSALRHLPSHHRPHRLDFLGAVLMAAGTATLLLALSWGGVRYAWASSQIAGLLLVSVAFWVLFGLRLSRAAEPFIPLPVLGNQVVLTGMLAACFAMGTFIGLTIYMPVYFEAVLHLQASDSGLALIPLTLGTVVGATISGRLMARFKHYKRIPLGGLTLALAVVGLLAIYADDMALVWVELALSLLSAGLGTILPVCTISIQNAVRPHELGTATSVANFFRQLGGAVIVAAFGAILLVAAPRPGPGGLVASRNIASNLHEVGAAFRWVFVASFLCLALAYVFMILMEERPLRSSAVKAADAASAD
jgi:EmrB/QacA subfamily drug resistance transporter